MVSPKKYYKNVRVKLDGTALSIRVKKQLGKVIERLPDEEQFRMRGSIYICNKDLMQNFLVKASMRLHTGDPMTVSVRDANNIYDIREDLEDSQYATTLVTDSLDGKSEDGIMGLIAYKLSEWSRLWRKMKDIPNWEDLENHERKAMISELFGFRFPVGTKKREEYEKSVYDEVVRLGFKDEFHAYELRL